MIFIDAIYVTEAIFLVAIGLSTGEIVGIVVGVLLVAAVAVLCLRRLR